MQEIILKVRYFERGLSKSLKKGNFIFFSNPVPFNRQNYQKQKTIDETRLLLRLIQVTKQVQKIISYVLSDQV